MATEPRKRVASEIPDDMFTDQEQPAAAAAPTESAAPRRPATIVGGTMLVVARALGSAVWSVVFFAKRHEFSATFDLDADETAVLVGFVLICTSTWMLLLGVLAALIWRGSNRSRMLVLCGVTLSVLTSAAGYFAAGEQITIQTTLVTLSLDILILLALSSRESRGWSRAIGQRRRARRAAARAARRRG